MDKNLATNQNKEEKKMGWSSWSFDKEGIKKHLLDILGFYFAKTPPEALKKDWLHALTILIRGHIFSRLNEIKVNQKNTSVKFVNYISMEFLIGKSLCKNIALLELSEPVKEVLHDYGLSLEELEAEEPEPGLGNGGLGRLAACFMDSLSALGLPAFGYGIRYQYGMFAQLINNGQQMEAPDMWLINGYKWEIHRPEIKYIISFYGSLAKNDKGEIFVKDTQNIYARAYDILIASYKGKQITRIRLWSAASTEDALLDRFKIGAYEGESHEKTNAQDITNVLYPDDSTYQGKELRLKQEYFLSSASVQDILFRFTRNHHDFADLPKYQAIHLNDTHPALAVPEYMRVLTLCHGVSWDKAWQYCKQTFSYTNHTLLPEALETWGVDLMGKVVPQILDIIYHINQDFLSELRAAKKYDDQFLARVSLINEIGKKSVRMSHLSTIASHKINGVSKLHSGLMKQTIFKDLHTIFPDRFINITNGITHRRWLIMANPKLSELITSKIGDGWKVDFQQIKKLTEFIDDQELQINFAKIKRDNKQYLANYIKDTLGEELNPDSLFDVHIKRIHEYKRQMLNLLHVVHRYNAILDNPDKNWVPRTVIIAGKAASSYYIAKLIIRLIHDVANKINQDSRTNHLLKLIFIPNYSVKLAEIIIPAADLSEQISTAGFEASGTGNMKFSVNGALTIGTYDGANIEIRDAVGAENFFLFGNKVEELAELRSAGYDPFLYYENDQNLKKIIHQIRINFSSNGMQKYHTEVVNRLISFDHFMVLADFNSYIKAQDEVDRVFDERSEWVKKTIINLASMGNFSSDYTIKNYAKDVWDMPIEL
ncbi:MAG: glycogen/starch/alpha-glucan phosphorylase [SAR324 cluster bacterium]|nr:glycogen/starch/alpha-glucan phosphorylase [SAR324 cluster bacterium]